MMIPTDSSITRRRWLAGLAAGAAVGGWADEAMTLHASEAIGKRWDSDHFRAEVRLRSQQHLQQRRLMVDYYRIRYRLAYSLPVSSLSLPDVAIPGIKGYPWATWLLWAMEERIAALGWAAEWFHDEAPRQAAWSDLAALAQWPEYGQYPGPDLSSAHAGRILWRALDRWSWINENQRRILREACCRHAESVARKSDAAFKSIETKEDVLRQPAPHSLLHNIPLIGTIGAALTASVAGHAAAPRLSARVAALYGASLELRAQGFSEGVGYDGYVLDFIADWLGVLSAQDRRAIVDHPHLAYLLEESYMLGAPGAVEQVAELSDVEPREMAFHLSAQAKLLRWCDSPTRTWLLGRCCVDWLRSNGLAAMADASQGVQAAPPRAGALDAHYAAVLRSGWEAEDLAVAVSCSTSPMGHIQRDGGTLCIGTRGKWFITDPGYQQYQPGEEREFTVGPTAHNTPLINGAAQTQKRARRMALEGLAPDVRRLTVDLTACYPSSAGLKTLTRHVWEAGNRVVVVADCVEAASPLRATYHWHGHPACAWWIDAPWATVAQEGAQLWFTSPQAQLSGANLHRLAGTRGQLSLVVTIEPAGPVVWWVFVVGPNRPDVRLSENERQLQVEGRTFQVG